MKTAIVTGAGRGIGRAIALKLAGMGFNLVATGRNKPVLRELQGEIEAGGGKCYPLVAEFLDENAPSEIVKQTISRYGQLDLLINNAGLSYSGPISATDKEIWDRIHTVNARTPFFLCQAAIPHLTTSSNPVIINVGSVVGFKGYAGQAAYASSKHALTGFTKVLAKEVQALGIRVHLISPGGVNTDMVKEMRPDINTDELIQPEEIAEMVEFLVNQRGKGIIDHLYMRRFSGLAFD